MGYWGYYIVARSEAPLDEYGALAPLGDALALLEERVDGWQVWECPAAPEHTPAIGSMNRLAEETGAPALFGYVMDSDCVVLEAAGPGGGSWSACLAPEATAAHLGRDRVLLEDYFLPPEEAARHAVEWAAAGGLEADEGLLLDTLRAVADPSAEELFFRFLDQLGVVERSLPAPTG